MSSSTESKFEKFMTKRFLSVDQPCSFLNDIVSEICFEIFKPISMYIYKNERRTESELRLMSFNEQIFKLVHEAVKSASKAKTSEEGLKKLFSPIEYVRKSRDVLYSKHDFFGVKEEGATEAETVLIEYYPAFHERYFVKVRKKRVSKKKGVIK